MSRAIVYQHTEKVNQRLIDTDEIQRALRLLVEQGQVVELRALNALTRQSARSPYTASGYFNDPDALVRAAGDILAATGIYITLNPCKRGLITRANNRIRTADQMRIDKRTTSDTEILRYRWLPVDIDPLRQDGNDSSADSEHHAAIELAWYMYRTLANEGWPQAILADSGNGAHILYRLDFANTEQDIATVQATLTMLAERFDTDEAKIDTGVYNPARIMKLYGTRACKGDPTDEWPHRMSRILDCGGVR